MKIRFPAWLGSAPKTEAVAMPAAPAPAPLAPGIFHDIYDFSILPFGLGDAINWSIKSSLRCERAGRTGVHIHLVCDVKTSGCTILMPLAHATELFMLELLPVFCAHPLFSSLTLHGSRADFDAHWQSLAANDPAARDIYREHQEIYHQRTNPQAVVQFLRKKSSLQAEINDWYEATGNRPRLRVLPECAADAAALKASFPEKTFWVSLHSRLKKLDAGLAPSKLGADFDRDANFAHWYHFIERTGRLHPHVRFILLGRLQEKPLALLRLPNVVAPRALGMTTGHEIALVNQSHLFLGSLAGPAQIALFSPTDYDVMNCTEEGCEHLGIPFGHPHVPFATPTQRLHYGPETSDRLLEILEGRLTASGLKAGVSLPSTTHRFFISVAEENRELVRLVEAQLRPLLLKLEQGEAGLVRQELLVLEEAFPQVVFPLPDYLLLKELVDLERLPVVGEEARGAARARRALLQARLVQAIYPSRIAREDGLHAKFLPTWVGLRRDGWCSQTTSVQLGSSVAGSRLAFSWLATAGSEPVGLEIQVADEPAVRLTLPPGPFRNEIPLSRDRLRTDIRLRFEGAQPLSAADPHVGSALLDALEIVPPAQ